MTAQYVDTLNTGAGLMGQFEFTKAQAAFAQAVALSPDNPYGQLDVAIAVLNQTSDDAQERAIALFAPLLKNPLVGTHASYCTGLAQLFLGRPSEALPYFRACAESNPTNAHAAYYTAQCLELLGQVEQAFPWYERAEQLDPFLRSAVLGLQRASARLGQSEKSAEMLALFDRLANNPRSSLAEFKYTRMGSLGEVMLPTQTGSVIASDGQTLPSGPLFAPSTAMKIGNWEGQRRSIGLQSTVDIDGDGQTDLMWWTRDAKNHRSLMPLIAVIKTNAPDESESWSAIPDHPLARIQDVQQLKWGDINNDGRVDAVVTTENLKSGVDGAKSTAKTSWYEQGTNDQWTERSFGESLPIDAEVLALADLDHDGDVDLLVADTTEDGANHLRILYNRLDGTWQSVDLPLDSKVRVSNAAIIDIDRDGDLDIIASMKKIAASRAAVFVNDRLWSWTRDNKRYGSFESHSIMDAVAYSRNEDGTPMLAAIEYNSYHDGGPAGNLAVWAFELQGPRQTSSSYFGYAEWLAVVDASGMGHQNIMVGGTFLNRSFSFLRSPNPSVILYDAAGQPIEELSDPMGNKYDPPKPAILSGIGAVLFGDEFEMRGAGEGRAPVATISFRGRIDPAQQMRTNASGIGTSAVARIGGEWVAARQLPWNTSSGQSTDPCVIGLGLSPVIDFLSIDWPDSVTQSELQIPKGAHTIAETQRQISSCPVIFAWDGTKMGFVTDSLGVGGVGFLASVTQDEKGRLSPVYAPPRPWERIAIPSAAIAPREGKYEIALSEPMEELTAIDAVALKVYDLPPGWNMSFDERMGISDPQPTGAAIFWRESMLPVRAIVAHGTRAAIDQTDAARTRDFVAVDPGEIDSRFIGRTSQMLTLSLEFPQEILAGAGDPVLLMDGWIEYPYCSTNFAMWQARASTSPPTFEALDPATGLWITLVKEYGYPAGMPREAAFPISRTSLPKNCTTLRIVTNQELYVDRCRIVWSQSCPQAIERTLPLKSAVVRDSGYARRIPAAQRRPIYDYEARVPLWDCRKQPGWYTATGVDCSPLVTAIDDAVAIFAAGEEIRMTFDAAQQTLAANWTRAFVLDLNGWCKDMDFLTGDGATVAPLPMRDGSSAPSPDRAALHERFNTRYEAGR